MPALKYYDITSGTYKYVTGGMSQEAADARYALKTDTPVGLVSPWAGSGAPTGWLVCDGAAISRTAYAALYAVCGTAFGVGNGSTTFNLPDLRGRAAVSYGAGSFTGARGTVVGAETVTLTVNQMPVHKHTLNAGGSNFWGDKAGSTYGLQPPGGTPGAGFPMDNAGGGQAHSNIQPSMVLQFIIKF